MNLFDKISAETFHSQKFAFVLVNEEENVLTITLNRAAKRNALHPQMMNEIAYAFQYAHFQKQVWIVVIQAAGEVFCAGADLKAFAGNAEEHSSTIPAPKEKVLLGALFKKVYKPIIAKVTGDVYAGGFFFLTGSHIVIAQDNVKFGLPEVKRGLFPFQVMAGLLEIMPTRKVLDWCIRGYNLPVAEAEQFGLATQIASADKIDGIVKDIILELKENSPTAIRNGLMALDQLRPSQEIQTYLHEMLMQTIRSKDGQEGLSAFKQKRKPIWSAE